MTKENVIHLVRSAKYKRKSRADIILYSMKVVFDSYKLRRSPKIQLINLVYMKQKKPWAA
jgi:hypothetical protein